jgi:hypothetical protein
MKTKMLAMVLVAAGSMFAQTRGSYSRSNQDWNGRNASQTNEQYGRNPEYRHTQTARDRDDWRRPTRSFDRDRNHGDRNRNSRRDARYGSDFRDR